MFYVRKFECQKNSLASGREGVEGQCVVGVGVWGGVVVGVKQYTGSPVSTWIYK